jgi:hypothetical protein
VARLQAAGAEAVVLARDSAADPGRLEDWRPDLGIPAVQIGAVEAGRIKQALTAGETVRVRFAADTNAWGFTRFADMEAAGGPDLVGEYTTANTDRFPRPDNGWYSVHNPFVVGDAAYLSHYSDGVRVLDIGDPAHPIETGFFVPPDLPDRSGRPMKSAIWGVYAEEGLVYASDIAHGLWILTEDAGLVPTDVPSVTPEPTPTVTPTATPTGTPTLTSTAVPPTATATATPTTEPSTTPPPTWLPPPPASPTSSVTPGPPPSSTAVDGPGIAPHTLHLPWCGVARAQPGVAAGGRMH